MTPDGVDPPEHADTTASAGPSKPVATSEEPAGGQGEPATGSRHSRLGKLSPARLLTGGGLLVTFIAGVTALLFTLDPGVAPCLGGSNATITDTAVISHITMRQYLIDSGASPLQAQVAPNTYGVEILFGYRADSLRGAQIYASTTLLTVDADGTVGEVVSQDGFSQDQVLLGTYIVPGSCSETGSLNAFVVFPIDRSDIRFCSRCIGGVH